MRNEKPPRTDQFADQQREGEHTETHSSNVPRQKYVRFNADGSYETHEEPLVNDAKLQRTIKTVRAAMEYAEENPQLIAQIRTCALQVASSDKGGTTRLVVEAAKCSLHLSFSNDFYPCLERLALEAFPELDGIIPVSRCRTDVALALLREGCEVA